MDVWSGSGGGDVMTELVDSCLAVCCNLSQVGLSLEPLLNTVLHIITPPAKVCYLIWGSVELPRG